MKAVFALCSVLICCSAQAAGALPDQTYKDWFAGSTKDGYTVAMTINADGRVLAQFCYQDKHCEWRMSMDTSCKTGEKGLILINGDSVFTTSNITCLGILAGKGSDMYTYKIENWRGMEDILTSGSRLSICLPIHETQFAVYRFSTLGAVEASAYMGGPIVGERHSQQEILSRDTTL